MGCFSSARTTDASELCAAILRCKPDLVLVQGDTLTAYTGARAAHDQREDSRSTRLQRFEHFPPKHFEDRVPVVLAVGKHHLDRLRRFHRNLSKQYAIEVQA